MSDRRKKNGCAVLPGGRSRMAALASLGRNKAGRFRARP
ncbi:hypothetical protein Theco_2308 [Thermobacillus composti KWC4]|jgi:hypothetical protein|uniref:Uncharacterized protein n=1 Tax=Thermobacillus composti (strain DSM 18247 / JCM 13945 / KWC4) TaxID=717605 RepID=L0EFL9_THECK|nr:hypothetical protein Theco_2308 [Thermobacillus composti KWC4]